MVQRFGEERARWADNNSGRKSSKSKGRSFRNKLACQFGTAEAQIRIMGVGGRDGSLEAAWTWMNLRQLAEPREI